LNRPPEIKPRDCDSNPAARNGSARRKHRTAGTRLPQARLRLSTPAAAAVTRPAVTARQMSESVNPPAAESDHLLGFRGRVRGVRVPGSHSLSDTVIRGSAASEPEQLAAILRVAARLTRPPPMRNSIEGIYCSFSRPRRPYRRAALQLGKTRSLQPRDPAPVGQHPQPEI
jgi:hypothetical protein